MTLTIIPNLIQGSDEWLDARRGIVTASVVGKLITPKTVQVADNPESRSLTRLLVAERITGWTDPTFISDDMLRGQDDEPLARMKYAEHYAPVDEVGFMTLERDGWKLGYSPDGVVGDDGLIEVKSRRAKVQLGTLLDQKVPLENVAQMQCGLLVSGRQWCDYVSWCGGMPMFVKRVLPDKKWLDAIVEAAEVFEKTAAKMIDQYNASIVGLHPTDRSTASQGLVI